MKLIQIEQKKPSKRKALKIKITESQFKTLAEKVVLLQEQNLIEKTHLLKINHNLKK